MKILTPAQLFIHLQKLTSVERGPLLGLDVGSKYIGVSLSDKALKIADPLRVVLNLEKNPKYVADEFHKLVSDYSLSGFIIGRPLYKLQPSKRTYMVERFVNNMTKTGKLSDVHACYWDEMGTSKSNTLMLHGLGLKRVDEKSANDMMAAMDILQGYLDYYNSDKTKTEPWRGEMDSDQDI